MRCASQVAGQQVIEERHVVGAAAARKTAETLAVSLNVTATVYGADAKGEFVYGVYEPSDDAGEARSPVVQRLFAESAAASLTLKDRLIADIPEDSIRGFASLASSLGYLASQHKQAQTRSRARDRLRGALPHLLRRGRGGDVEPSRQRRDARAAQPPALGNAGLAVAERARRRRRQRSARRSTCGSRRERSRSISMASSKCCSRAPCSAASRRAAAAISC